SAATPPEADPIGPTRIEPTNPAKPMVPIPGKDAYTVSRSAAREVDRLVQEAEQNRVANRIQEGARIEPDVNQYPPEEPYSEPGIPPVNPQRRAATDLEMKIQEAEDARAGKPSVSAEDIADFDQNFGETPGNPALRTAEEVAAENVRPARTALD